MNIDECEDDEDVDDECLDIVVDVGKFSTTPDEFYSHSNNSSSGNSNQISQQQRKSDGGGEKGSGGGSGGVVGKCAKSDTMDSGIR